MQKQQFEQDRKYYIKLITEIQKEFNNKYDDIDIRITVEYERNEIPKDEINNDVLVTLI